MSFLSYLCTLLIILVSQFFPVFGQEEQLPSPICDVTQVVDGIVDQLRANRLSGETQVSNIGACKVFYYEADDILNASYAEVKELSNAFRILTPKTWSGKSDSQYQLILSCKLALNKKDTLGYTILNSSQKLQLGWPSNLIVSAMIFRWEETQPCQYFENGVSPIDTQPFFSGRSAFSERLGLGFTANSSGCPSFPRSLSTLSIRVVTIPFETSITNYDAFRKRMNDEVERLTSFLKPAHQEHFPRTIYRAQIRQSLIESKYRSVFAEFGRRWMAESKKECVVELVNVKFVQGEPLRDIAIPHFHSAPKYGSVCHLQHLYSLVATTFSNLMIDAFDWLGWSTCNWALSTSIKDKLHIHIYLYQNHSGSLQDQWRKELAFLERFVKLTNQQECAAEMRKTLIFRQMPVVEYDHSFLGYRDALLATVDQLPRTTTSVGCLLQFGPLNKVPTTDLAQTTVANCRLPTFHAASVVFWEFELDTGRNAMSKENFNSNLAAVETTLNKLNIDRHNLTDRYPQKRVVLKLVPTTVYEKECTDTGLRANQLVSAIESWTRLHGFPVVLKNVSSGAEFSTWTWWKELTAASSGCEGRLYRWRNLEQVCNKGKDETNSYLYEGVVGTTIRMGVKNETLKVEEVQTLLEFALDKFSSAEIILDSAHVKEEVEVTKKAIQNLETSQSQSVSVQFPIVAPDEVPLQQQFDKIQSLSAPGKSGEPAAVRSVHISNWESLGESAKTLLLENLKAKRSIGKANAKLGLVVQDCTNLDHLDQVDLFLNIDYIVCLQPKISTDIGEKGGLQSLMEGQLNLKKKIQLMLPALEIVFRLSIHGAKQKSGTEEYLRLVNEISEYARANNVTNLLPGFDNKDSDEVGWWGVKDYGDLSKPTIFVERESKYFNRTTEIPRTIILREQVANNLLLYISLISVAVLTIIVSFIILFLWKYKRQEGGILPKKEIDEFFKPKNIYALEDDDMSAEAYMALGYQKQFEIPKKNFEFDEKNILGKGQFGTVFRAIVYARFAAVKVPNAECTRESYRSLLLEIKILAYVGTHPNVVGFLGCYTREIYKGIIYVATELCENGSLLEYLRGREKSLQSSERGSRTIDPQELCKFAREIASGMAYIAGKRIIHGDLATRNVLLDEYNTCKIGDFGLSRKLYEYNQYVKTNTEPLPWRWMAPESLTKMEFTTKSDVWSYGVTIWEIFCLAEVPYPGRNWDVNFARELTNGLKMEKPEYCNDDNFAKMLECWNIEPESRPTFDELQQYFEGICNADYMLTFRESLVEVSV